MSPDEQWAWLLSTIAQTFGALIGIAGMLAVFKLQRIHDMIGTYRRDLKSSISYFMSPYREPSVSPEDWVDIWPSILQEKKDHRDQAQVSMINGITSSMEVNLELREEVREDFYVALRVTLALIVVSIIGLFNCKWLTENVISSIIIALLLTVIIALTVLVLLYFYKSLLITRLQEKPEERLSKLERLLRRKVHLPIPGPIKGSFRSVVCVVAFLAEGA